MSTKRELQEENERLREHLEDAYVAIGDALGFEDETENESDDSDLDGEDEE